MIRGVAFRSALIPDLTQRLLRPVAQSDRAAPDPVSYTHLDVYKRQILRSTPSGLEKGRTADTVWFHVHSERDSDGDLTITRRGFDNIADGEGVFQVIRNIQAGST